ncbi:NAD-dependent epimerase/dehydratase family protein [Aestuariivirga sp.]|jgi:UDP-glucose 4-epimerase|uniref:NAD-dependent epimerase/dehydratase family protein n=1 Tax=Aestuariivirga sp. TaxID=2650926 RepID=UPI003783B331
MRIAVTGSSGKLGSVFISAALARGCNIISIDRKPSESAANHERLQTHHFDLADFSNTLTALKGADALVHMATHGPPGIDSDERLHNNNVTASYNVLRAAAELGISRVCMASSVNAIGMLYSREPRFDYFPIDEKHASYTEDPYSLSKWIAESQAQSFARRYPKMSIASLRFHWVVADSSVARKAYASNIKTAANQLWGYTPLAMAVDASLASLTAAFAGHEVLNVVAPDSAVEDASLTLASRYYPSVPIVGDLSGRRSFFDTSKASQLLKCHSD